jgi:hypothetical protein
MSHPKEIKLGGIHTVMKVLRLSIWRVSFASVGEYAENITPPYQNNLKNKSTNATKEQK